MKKNSFRIALSALSCAAATIFLTIGMYVSVLTATGYMFAAIALMLPLAKDFRSGGFLAYIATCLLSLLIGGGFGQIWRLFLFIAFFGLHPLVNSLQQKYRVNKWIALAVKTVWFDVCMWLFWEFSQLLTVEIAWVDKYIVLIIAVVGSAFFVFYDWLMFRCQKLICFYVAKIDKSGKTSAVRHEVKENKAEDIFPDLADNAQDKEKDGQACQKTDPALKGVNDENAQAGKDKETKDNSDEKSDKERKV